MKLLVLSLLGWALILCSCTPKEEHLFNEISADKSGVTFANTLKDSRDLNILTYLYYYNGAGVSAGDYNGDGLVDLYFTANQGPDKLYLNRGNLTFEDITAQAGINNENGWTTGVTHADINDDGLLDIYVSKVGNFKNIEGRNLLFINGGNDANGVPVFKEQAAEVGLDVSGFSTQATFFDYDLDGDLDCFLMRHSVFPNRNYGKGERRNSYDPRAGDLLLRNDNGLFTDIGEEAGIFQGITGYGLGLGISDLNNDGYPDIYVGNDFFENDYLYLNQKDGTFREIIAEDDSRLGHTTHYSMGNDMADINNDGLIDIVSVDMLPEDLETYKTSSLEYPYPIYQNYLRNGYAPQYMQNTLHLNLGNSSFSEIAHLSGISATEWSWAPLLADFDNDGFKDLFVTNGIKGATNDMDFINFIANEEIQQQLNRGMTDKEMGFIEKMPTKKVANYFFKNTGDLKFTNMTNIWSSGSKTYTQGCVYADLDNDGDLDLVLNNVDARASILENSLSKSDSSRFLKINFKGSPGNQFGIGAKVEIFNQGRQWVQENYTTRGYLSAVPPTIHMGLGSHQVLDSVRVTWPGGAVETRKNVSADQTLSYDQDNATGNILNQVKKSRELLRNSALKLPFIHRDNNTLEFNRDPLVPFANTNEGPGVSVADVNLDGLEDIFIGGGKGQAASLMLQQAGAEFTPVQDSLFRINSLSEDVSHIFFNANGDKYPDLIVVSGGNEFKDGPNLQPRLYLNNKGILVRDLSSFQSVSVQASKVLALDYDKDGDEDLIITSDQVPLEFGQTPRQFLFENRRGEFLDVTAEKAEVLMTLGQVRDVIWADLNGNGEYNLVLAGPWMAITILKYSGSRFEKINSPELDYTIGWWEAIATGDMDNDGDLDIIAGNWGENSKFKASHEEPLTLYSADFDKNGTIDPLVTYFHGGKETPFASKDELTKQMPFLNREFLSYKKFAQANLKDLFTAKALSTANKKQLYTLASIYIENMGNGEYSWKKLPPIAQIAPLTAMYVDDFNADGLQDLLILGNRYEISTQLGRLDASHGLLLQNQKNKGLTWLKSPSLDVAGQAREISRILIDGRPHFVVSRNNAAPIVLRKMIMQE